MTERLLAKNELLLIETETRTTTLRQCGEWLDKVLYSHPYAGKRIATLELSMEALKRGEAPWEGK